MFSSLFLIAVVGRGAGEETEMLFLGRCNDGNTPSLSAFRVGSMEWNEINIIIKIPGFPP